jgi:NADH-quinone oxidoreductase subunit L
MLELAWIIPALTLAAWAVILLLGKRLPDGGSFVGILAVGAGFVMSVAIAVDTFQHGGEPFHRGGEWATFGPGLTVGFGYTVDGLAAALLVVVTTVSLLVQVYSTAYMKERVTEGGVTVLRPEPRYTFYFSCLSLFTFGMLLVVLADNLLLLLVGWEVMGLCSYFLIGHYWEERPYAAAAIKAFLTTKLGDVGFLFGIIVLFWAAGSFDIQTIIDKVDAGQIDPTMITLGAVLLFCGAIGKSAQFPLHTWLPDAMAGPTPVSALIHAATMVAAGVFLVARMYPVFEHSAAAMNEIALLASITMVISALLALIQDDIKRVLAYSTVSQLAYMMAALGVGGYTAGIFHLFTHAFFKALLFLAAGSIIHAVHSNYMSEMGGLRRAMPVTFWTMLIGSLALAGVFPLAGFWSKDEIIHDAYATGFGTPEAGVLTTPWVAQVVFVAGVITAFLTALYVARMLWLTFGGSYRGSAHPHESGPVMTGPLVLLAAGAIFAGFINSPLVGESNFERWIAPPEAEGLGVAHIDFTVAGISTIVALAGLVLGTMLYRRGLPDTEYVAKVPGLYRLLEQRYYLDALYDAITRFVRGPLARATYAFDQKAVDGAVNGAARGTGRLGGALRYLQTGQAQWYAAALFAGVVIVAIAFTARLGG